MDNPSIASALGDALRQSQARAPAPYFRASSIGQCPAAQIGLRAGLPVTNPWTRRVEFKLWVGTVLHDTLQQTLLKTGFLEPGWSERELTVGSYVGHPDGLTTALPCGPAIVEFKTADDNAITKPDWPEHYLWQGLWYCLAAKVDHLLLFQLGKNQGLSRERVVPLTDEWRQRLADHMLDLGTAWEAYQETHTLPPHVHTFGWEDRTCPYLNLAPQNEGVLTHESAGSV